jgi:hypothetical protein
MSVKSPFLASKPAEETPLPVQRALRNARTADAPLTEAQKSVDQLRIREGGEALQTYSFPSCPVGPGNWVRVKTDTPWVECEKKLGFRWFTPEGWCYPEGVCGVSFDDPELAFTQTVRKTQLIQNIIRQINAIRTKQRQDWLALRLANLVKEGQLNANSREDQITALKTLEKMLPEELQEIPSEVVILRQRAGKAYLKHMSSALEKEGLSPSQRKDLETAIRESKLITVPMEDVPEFATNFYRDAKACSTGTLLGDYRHRKAMCEDGVRKDVCSFYDAGDPDTAVCIPKIMYEFHEAWEASNYKADPFAMYWKKVLAEQKAKAERRAANSAGALLGSASLRGAEGGAKARTRVTVGGR